MKNKIVLFLLTVFLIQLSVCSCTYYSVDPFLTETNGAQISGDDSKIPDGVTGADTEARQDSPVRYLTYTRPDDDFYGLSVEEAYEKYGLLTLSRTTVMEYIYDGTYTYNTVLMNPEDPSTMTLYRREYPNGKISSPVCTDPLCTHTAKSGCPLSQLQNSSYICYSDKIFIVKSNGELLMYDKKTNKSTRLLSSTYDGAFSIYNGELCFCYNEFNSEFEYERIMTKISEEGAITELKRFKEYYTADLNIYGDGRVLDYRYETYDNGDGKVILYSRETQSDDVYVIMEIDCPEAVKFAAVDPYQFYGNKLLIRCRYYTEFPNKNRDDERDNIWLVDLVTKEKRLLCSLDYYTQKRLAACVYSSKCAVWEEPRFKESDPMIMHVYFPYEDKELTYNLSDMIKTKTGDDNLPLSVICPGNTGSALVLYDNDPNVLSNVYEVDLENGNVYKYDG